LSGEKHFINIIYHMPWNSFNTIRNKGKRLPTPPSISFSRAVTTTTVNVSGVNYKVYDISGTTDTWNETASPITCSIYSESPITIYYLVVGSGGSGNFGGGSVGGGGGGAGGFLEGNFNLLGNTVVKNIGINVGTPSGGGIAGKFSMIDCSFQNTRIIAGGGGSIGTNSGNAPTVPTGTGIISIRGGGAGGNFYGSYGGSGGVNFGGGGANSISGGASGEYGGSGGTLITVNTTTRGITQRFTSATFCNGGGGNSKYISINLTTNGTYGSGGGGGGGNASSSSFTPGLTGIVAIAIRTIDIP
jgi:hypothetical protein